MGEEEDPEQLDRLQSKINHQVDNWNKYCQIEEELHESGEDQLSTVDSYAKAVVLLRITCLTGVNGRQVVNVGYNIQAASDGKHKMVVAVDTQAL